ncbi:hypothetical protein FKM82_026113 [Ascaphus truei]
MLYSVVDKLLFPFTARTSSYGYICCLVLKQLTGIFILFPICSVFPTLYLSYPQPYVLIPRWLMGNPTTLICYESMGGGFLTWDLANSHACPIYQRVLPWLVIKMVVYVQQRRTIREKSLFVF